MEEKEVGQHRYLENKADTEQIKAGSRRTLLGGTLHGHLQDIGSGLSTWMSTDTIPLRGLLLFTQTCMAGHASIERWGSILCIT